MQQALIILGLVLCLLIPSLLLAKDSITPLILAKTFKSSMQHEAYWVSEKLDGIRCYWSGEQLYTRNGNPIHAPTWFIKQLPQTPLDGELWAGRGEYQTVAQTVLDKTPNDKQWREIQFQVFDLPHNKAPFEQRQKTLKSILEDSLRPNVVWVEQTQLRSLAAINKALESVVKNGGEGLMLRPVRSLYEAGRSNNLLKLKPRYDSEARVIAYQAGRGKFENMMGAIWVELSNGKMFKIGSGFSELERKEPPPIGSRVTFSHQGFTEKGLPRFATYERIKVDE
ncbi:DNA ligase [Oceaniserpentilla sp. 4NH20-0058]|uniref:DNA ligase n=1 Tax=Oceaniserpentilla sp. 4NH20-0058 TaxID=3127660 RepID=UPI0031033F83